MTWISSYSFNCSVCKGEYFSKSDWSRHLSSKRHQLLARKEAINHWQSPSVKKCCLVIYTSFPLSSPSNEQEASSGADKIIQYFSRGPCTFVTNFVWWEERDQIGIVQFESENVLKELLASLPPANTLIRDKGILVKRSTDLLDLELTAMMPAVQEPGKVTLEMTSGVKRSFSPAISRTDELECSKRPKTDGTCAGNAGRKTAIDSLEDFVQSRDWPRPKYYFTSVGKGVDLKHFCSVVVNDVPYRPGTLVFSKDSRTAQRKAAAYCLEVLQYSFGSNNGQGTISEVLTANTTAVGNSDAAIYSLQDQFKSVQKSIAIPCQQHSKTLEIIAALQALFSQEISTAQVTWFRNRFLKLRSPSRVMGSDDLLIYAHNATSPSVILGETINAIFEGSLGLEQFTLIPSIYLKQRGWRKVKHKASGFQFILVTDHKYLAEVQMCRMLDYMCSFDVRCLPLMTLAYHWYKTNGLVVGKSESIPNSPQSHMILREPLTIQWLVMFFLCHKGILPTPRDIQARPHQVLLLNDKVGGKDVGFDADPNFVQDWRANRGNVKDTATEEFMLGVVILLQEFLNFCGNLFNDYKGNWILNTRDGELIPTDALITKEGATVVAPLPTKLSYEEVAELKSLHKPKSCSTAAPGRHVNFDKTKLYMMHPLVVTWTFMINKDVVTVLKVMQRTGERIQQFLDMRGNNAVKSAASMFGRLDSVLRLGRLAINDIRAEVAGGRNCGVARKVTKESKKSKKKKA